MTDSPRCRECLAEVEHCHGTVILHLAQRAECTEPDCTTPEVLHAFRIDCVAVGCVCADSAGRRLAV
ncbi:hypothetical protein C731_4128 [Mycolicibacterium hassiacum DSM 44199]|jgi:5-formyltetrahydrofolate cyclo-ligase|uniref:Uncharacterized protein n=1 Tax=Mycolicibacterium hassiacum (strain DSM 44199 / CIP 105218 / JCM 12690 / 3849) TaxID=1122247 RepID=K5B7G6_MYCHD|nr:hypothetical protein [Mycolicibacterium hassiacum]EKF21913.1 hypothetical protein C731_4128 [Mycolicibacterium hassiacum DSM 44199]MDA4085385.1 hypothetical protein [Mycolicibacterium hassiacum DSM 44199]PZN20182.1 MAG: hypothetical protein DIU75_13020 [Mycolicibacterium hassiacum]VCT92747.1 hypothetical protein MHAS_04477 [Mycolicibacterium hassiacum DSM 44199]